MNHARGSKEINRTFVQRCTEARPLQGSLARVGFVSECYVSRNIGNETCFNRDREAEDDVNKYALVFIVLVR